MKYVLDSSVAVKWVLKEAGTPNAITFRDEVRNKIHEIIAPDVFPSEIAHALTRAERKKLIPVGQAVTHFYDILTTGPTLHPYLPLLPRAIATSSLTKVAITDCIFLTLAEVEGCLMLTADQKLITNLPGYPIIHLDSL